MCCSCSPDGCLRSSLCFLSALSFWVCREGNVPSPKPPCFPPETFLVQTLPAPVLASFDCGRTPRPAAQMSQRPDCSLSGGASWCGNLQDDSEEPFECWSAHQGCKRSLAEKVCLAELEMRWVSGWGQRGGEGKQGRIIVQSRWSQV